MDFKYRGARLGQCSGMSLEARRRRSLQNGSVTDELRSLLRAVEIREPADVAALNAVAAASGTPLPKDYLAFMATSDGEVGAGWIELWPVARIESVRESSPRYEGVLLFAGDGANTIYGFDGSRDGEIVEGDWIGLDREELIPHGRTLTALLRGLDAAER